MFARDHTHKTRPPIQKKTQNLKYRQGSSATKSRAQFPNTNQVNNQTNTPKPPRGNFPNPEHYEPPPFCPLRPTSILTAPLFHYLLDVSSLDTL